MTDEDRERQRQNLEQGKKRAIAKLMKEDD